jgi:hypothetical protein
MVLRLGLVPVVATVACIHIATGNSACAGNLPCSAANEPTHQVPTDGTVDHGGASGHLALNGSLVLLAGQPGLVELETHEDPALILTQVQVR